MRRNNARGADKRLKEEAYKSFKSFETWEMTYFPNMVKQHLIAQEQNDPDAIATEIAKDIISELKAELSK